ncbi:MAG: hypothetical protein ACLQT6_11635 [Desulfomonilaceae bacterium]
MEKDAQGLKLLEKKPFDTDSGIKGKILVINCSALPEDGPKFADIFDTAEDFPDYTAKAEEAVLMTAESYRHFDQLPPTHN